MKPLRVSVVTPSYNQGRFLEATLRSIHEPGYPNLEHIVMDGGSTDGSVQILEQYSAQIAHWESRRDAGQTDALIRGFERATGDVLAWLNSDDLYEPNTLSEVAEFFAANPHVDFVYGDAVWVDRDGVVVKPKREHRFSHFVWLYDHNYIPQPSAFFRKSLYERVGGLDASFDLAMDGDLWSRFSLVTRPMYVRRQWSRMRFYAEQKNTARRSESHTETRRILERHGIDPDSVLHPYKRGVARATRVAMKAIAGGYSRSEVSAHLGRLLGRGTWEDQEVERQRTSEISGDGK